MTFHVGGTYGLYVRTARNFPLSGALVAVASILWCCSVFLNYLGVVYFRTEGSFDSIYVGN